MKRNAVAISRNDKWKIVFVFTCAILAVIALAQTPSLGSSVLLSVVFAIVIAPTISAIERRGYSRGLALTAVFLLLTLILVTVGYVTTLKLMRQWDAFTQQAPHYIDSTISRLQAYELDLKSRFPFLRSVQIVEWLKDFKNNTAQWFISNGAAMMGNILTLFFLVPIITIVLLKDGRVFQKKFYELIPNRFFETVFMVTHKIVGSLSDYIRAKLVEAFIVGLITSVGFVLIGAPYALVLGIIAAVTNILPYVGPILGALPGILIVAADPVHSHLLWPVVAVYLGANILDNVVIFPLVVANLVNLHPLLLIAVVMMGQQYYGLIGMLISIPVATALKVIIQEIFYFVYGHSSFPTMEE